MRVKRLARLLLFGFVIVAAGASPAQAREGRLDTTFGDRGRVVVDGVASSMAVGADSSLVLMSRTRLVRFTPDGDLDRRFGRDGNLAIPPRVGGGSFRSADVALDSRGRVLQFGTTSHREVDIGYGESVRISRAAVLRLLPSGQRDYTFGSSGVVAGDFGLQSDVPAVAGAGQPTTGIYAGAVDSLDRPLALLANIDGYAPCHGHTALAYFPRGVARLTATGLPDPQFGEGDGLSLGLSDVAGFLPALALTGSNEPLVAGLSGSGCSDGAAVFRFNDQGVGLQTYGIGGRREFRNMRFGAFAEDGGVILRSEASPTRRLRRATPEGFVDSSFGINGVVRLQELPGANQTFRTAAVDEEGRILLVGSYSLPTAAGRERAFLLVQRLLKSGKPDLNFGRRSRISVHIPEAEVLGHNQATLDAEGRLLVFAEKSRVAKPRDGEGVLLRFRLGK